MMKAAYPAIMHSEDDGWWVEFPDLEGCFTDGETMADAAMNAEEALGLYLCTLTEQGQQIPEPSDMRSVQTEDGFVTLVATDLMKYRRSTRAVKKTLTIPEWLNTEAEKRHINFSSVLQQALLGMIE